MKKMILSSELLPNWDTKKMNLDEQISKRVDKGYRFELWNENVIILTQNKIQKGAVFTALFFYFNEKISDE